MAHKIRELLDWLSGERTDAIPRLCEIREVTGRGLDAKCEALARSYRGNHAELFDDLLKKELAALLERGEFSADGDIIALLPRAMQFPKEQLVEIAMKFYVEGDIPAEFTLERIEDEDDDDDDEDDDDDDDDDEGLDAIEKLRHEARVTGPQYAQSLASEFQEVSNPAPRRAYQDEAFAKIWSELGPGKRPLLQIATGGGKTHVANDLLVRWDRENSARILWITKDWRLLVQAARDLCRRHGYSEMVSRMGGDGKDLHPLPNVPKNVQYTTIQTLAGRLRQKALSDIGLVVWDECHWGEGGKAGHAILKAIAKRNIALLGLTATPKPPERSTFRVVYSKTFGDLVEERHLARPVLEKPVQTGMDWAPSRNTDHGDFAPASLRELDNQRRNQMVVNHYVANAAQYGQTIVFACNMDHATRLADLFVRKGVKARAMHSDNGDFENKQHLDEFRQKKVDVVVNVEMLTHGVDVPSVRTVFMARPTSSDVLYSQMVGRASRLDPSTGKTTFNVVEFTDNMLRHADILCTGKIFFEGSGSSSSGSGTGAGARPAPQESESSGAYRFDPAGAPTGIPNDGSVPEAMRGLWYRKGQTFGFEIELTMPGVIDARGIQGTQQWHAVAEDLRRTLEARLPGRVASRVFDEYQGTSGEKSYSEWNVEFDSSVGWEVTSRVLVDEVGYREIVDACEAIEECVTRQNLKINFRTGLHLHLAWKARNPTELRNFLRLVRVFEPGLASIVAPSRVASFEHGRYYVGTPNPYCLPLAHAIRGADLGPSFDMALMRRRMSVEGARCSTVNITPLLSETTGTVEIRMHGGTTEARKMLLWLSLWQQILWAASNGLQVPDVPDRAFLEPDADILQLARTYLPDARLPGQREFLGKLAARRAELVAEWAKTPTLSSWVQRASSWTS